MSAPVFVKLFVIFAVVAIGWAVARSGRLGNDATRTLSSAAFYIFVPALLFRTTSRIDFSKLDAAVLLAFFLPTLALLGIVYTFERARRAKAALAPAGPSVRAINASFGNTVQVGIPLAAALFGETGLALHVTIISLHGLTMLTVLTAMAETDLALARHRSEPSANARLFTMLAGTVRNTVIHPVVLPVLAGLACNAAGIAVPAFVDDVLVLLGQAVVPVCLILIGVSLAFYGVRGSARSAVKLSLVKLLVHPLAVLAGGPLGLRPDRHHARRRGDDGRAAGRQQRPGIRAALRHPAGRIEHRHRLHDPRLRGHGAALAGGLACHRLSWRLQHLAGLQHRRSASAAILRRRLGADACRPAQRQRR